VFDGANLQVYVNGNLDGTLFAPGTLQSSTDPLFIGSYWQSLAVFPGQIDEVAVYNRALNRREVQAIYEAGSAGKCQGAPTFEATGSIDTSTLQLGSIAPGNVYNVPLVIIPIPTGQPAQIQLNFPFGNSEVISGDLHVRSGSVEVNPTID